MRCGGCIMIEDENTAWLISMLESEMAEYRHYTPCKQLTKRVSPVMNFMQTEQVFLPESN